MAPPSAPPPCPPPMPPPPSPPPPSLPWSALCPAARTAGKTESLMSRNIPGSNSEWCSIYSAANFKHSEIPAGDGFTSAETHCKAAFVMYDTDPPTYQSCAWHGERIWGGSNDHRDEDVTGKCKLAKKLYPCQQNPPAPPSPPPSPPPPSPPPGPSPPVLCPVLGADMVSVRDMAEPKWCNDYTKDQALCEKAYIRLGQTYVRCAWSPVNTFLRDNKFAPQCTADLTTKAPCGFAPPSPPAPPSTPSTCPRASMIGLKYDLRDWSPGTAWTSGHRMAGDRPIADCSVYTHEEDNCKHAYQTDGNHFYPCLFRNSTLMPAPTCLPSPGKRSC